MKKKSKSSDQIAGISPFDDSKWRAQNDLDTLLRAEEIEGDPKRLAAAKKLAREKLEDMKDILAEDEKQSDKDDKGKKK